MRDLRVKGPGAVCIWSDRPVRTCLLLRRTGKVASRSLSKGMTWSDFTFYQDHWLLNVDNLDRIQVLGVKLMGVDGLLE